MSEIILQWSIAAAYAGAGLLLIIGLRWPKMDRPAVAVATMGLLLHLGMACA